VPNGTVLPVVGVDMNRAGFFYIVRYDGQEYSVKHSNTQSAASATGPVLNTMQSPFQSQRSVANVAQPQTSGDIFLSTQVTKATELVLDQIKGCRRIKASMNPFNRKGAGRLPAAVEEFDAPAYGVRAGNAILEILSIDGMEDVAESLRIYIPKFQLNTVVQRKIQTAVRNFKNDARWILSEEWWAVNANAMAKLEAFANSVALLEPDSAHVTSMPQWDKFVRRFAYAGWQSRMHVNEVLLNFGFSQPSVSELNIALANMREDGVKESIVKALGWFSKALGCYGLAGSLSDPVNLAFAMMGVRVLPNEKITEDMVIDLLSRFKAGLEELPSNYKCLWVPSIHVHDCEMDDMLALLILSFVHSKFGSKLEVYAQLPSGKQDEKAALDEVEGKLEHSSTQVYRDREAANVTPISEYWLRAPQASPKAKPKAERKQDEEEGWEIIQSNAASPKAEPEDDEEDLEEEKEEGVFSNTMRLFSCEDDDDEFEVELPAVPGESLQASLSPNALPAVAVTSPKASLSPKAARSPSFPSRPPQQYHNSPGSPSLQAAFAACAGFPQCSAAQEYDISQASPSSPQFAIAQQVDGHPDVVLRKTPTPIHGEIVGKIPNGTMVLILGPTHDDYAAIQVQSKTQMLKGWAKQNNLQLQNFKPPTTQAISRSTAVVQQRDGHSHAMLREATHGDVVAKLSNGDIVHVLGPAIDDWIEIEAQQSCRGWIKRHNLRM